MESKIFQSLKWDRSIEEYHHDLIAKIELTDIMIKSNQFYLFYDLYKRQRIFLHPNIEKILGVKAEFFDIPNLFSHIHPVDRNYICPIAINAIHSSFKNKQVREFEDVFLCDYRFKKEKSYIRLLTEYSCAAKDKKGNVLVALLMFSDITGIKDSKRVGYAYHGNMTGFYLPKLESLNGNCLFSLSEVRVLELLSQGLESKQIAGDLCLSRHTVDTHRRRMLHKSCSKNTVELIEFARRTGVI
jgi:DNA-binding CsgD family transcriptional regulator